MTAADIRKNLTVKGMTYYYDRQMGLMVYAGTQQAGPNYRVVVMLDAGTREYPRTITFKQFEKLQKVTGAEVLKVWARHYGK